MAAAESTVRIHAATRDKLRELATEEGRTIPDVLGELVEREDARRMLVEHNAAMEHLRANPEAWADWKAETAPWEATLMDGLRDL
jgi:hypothetical protein